MKARYEGDTWRDAWAAVYNDQLTTRGAVSSSDGKTGPALTNREAVALLDEWRGIARQLGVSFSVAHYLASPAYGYLAPGDAFVVDDENAERAYSPEVAGLLWWWTGDLAEQLDAADKSAGARRLLPHLDAYTTAADDVQRDVAEDGGKCKIPLPGIPPDQWPDCPEKIPPPFDKAPVPLPSLKGPIRALALLAGFFLLARDILGDEDTPRRRRRRRR